MGSCINFDFNFPITYSAKRPGDRPHDSLVFSGNKEISGNVSRNKVFRGGNQFLEINFLQLERLAHANL